MHGIATRFYGKRAIIGSDHLIFEDEGIPKTEELNETIGSLESEVAESMICLEIDNQVAGIISIYDPLKLEENKLIII